MPALSGKNEVAVSALQKTGIEELKERIAALGKENQKERMLVRDLVKAEDLVVLVTPIDSSAPKGRLILPQQQTIRDLLEADAIPVVTKENTLKTTLESLAKKPFGVSCLLCVTELIFPSITAFLFSTSISFGLRPSPVTVITNSPAFATKDLSDEEMAPVMPPSVTDLEKST